MAVTGFAHYNLTASLDVIEQLKNFYCEVLGLKVGPRPPFERFGYWLYIGEQAILHLIVSKPGQKHTTNVLTTLDHVAFYATQQTVMEERLTRNRIKYRVSSVPDTGESQLFFHDPAGNGVELNFAAVKT